MSTEQRPMIGVVTCSDRCSRGEAADTAGPALVALAEARGWPVVASECVPDDGGAIAEVLVRLADELSADVVFTCGGTGLGPRDVTPEATLAVCDREAPGIAEYIRAESAKVTKRAMLSRGVAAVRGRTLIVNVPGSEKAARESFGFVADQLPHAVEMLHGGGH